MDLGFGERPPYMIIVEPSETAVEKKRGLGLALKTGTVSQSVVPAVSLLAEITHLYMILEAWDGPTVHDPPDASGPRTSVLCAPPYLVDICQGLAEFSTRLDLRTSVNLHNKDLMITVIEHANCQPKQRDW